jgi:hypothetical protein
MPINLIEQANSNTRSLISAAEFSHRDVYELNLA